MALGERSSGGYNVSPDGVSSHPYLRSIRAPESLGTVRCKTPNPSIYPHKQQIETKLKVVSYCWDSNIPFQQIVDEEF